MDSPLSSPRLDRARFSKDDDDDIATPLLFQWAYSMKPLYRALFFVILGSACSALVFSSLPLWRPVGVLMLHKLWDILRFVVLTTSIGLGISNFWRGNCGADADRDANRNSSSGGKEDSVSSKVPGFVSMFYSELQPSYSFNDDKEMEVIEYGVVRRSGEVGEDALAKRTRCHADGDDDKVKHDGPGIGKGHADDGNAKVKHDAMDEKIASDTSANASIVPVQSDTKPEDVDGSDSVEEPPISLLSAYKNAKVAPTSGKPRLPTAIDDMGLGSSVVGNEEPKHSGKIIHRRGNSLEFPIEQEGRARRHGDMGFANDQRRKDVDTSGERSSMSKKTHSSIPKVSDHAKRQSVESISSKPHINSTAPVPSSTSTSKHSRSRSAYDLNDLLMYDHRPRSKPGSTSQLARRRNVSLSCDLDKDYTVTGVPAWLASIPPPPMPPPVDSYAGGANRGIALGERVNGKQQKDDESSLRRAYTESLAPWRVATVAVPVDIPQKEASEKSQKHSTTKEEKKAPLKENTRESTPPSPSTPTSFMGSPSPGELNKKVGDFIARFHERMRLQRLESLERSRHKAH